MTTATLTLTLAACLAVVDDAPPAPMVERCHTVCIDPGIPRCGRTPLDDDPRASWRRGTAGGWPGKVLLPCVFMVGFHRGDGPLDCSVLHQHEVTPRVLRPRDAARDRPPATCPA